MLRYETPKISFFRSPPSRGNFSWCHLRAVSDYIVWDLHFQHRLRALHCLLNRDAGNVLLDQLVIPCLSAGTVTPLRARPLLPGPQQSPRQALPPPAPLGPSFRASLSLTDCCETNKKANNPQPVLIRSSPYEDYFCYCCCCGCSSDVVLLRFGTFFLEGGWFVFRLGFSFGLFCC